MTPANRITLDTAGNILINFPPDLGKISQVKDITYSHYDRVNKVWKVPSTQLLAVTTQFPGFALSDEVQALVDTYAHGELASKNRAISTVFGLNLDVINGRKLFKHQKEAIYSILKQKRLVLAHQQGLGKTTSALIAGKITGLPIYVVCGRSLFVTWQREADLLGITITKLVSWAKIPQAPTEDFYVCLDEAHALQSMKAAQTKKAITFCNSARYVICITGTPSKGGKPSNLFGMLTAIKHPLSFRKPVYDKQFGASNLLALWEATRGSILFKKVEDCVDLPEKIRSLRIAEMTPEATLSYNNAFSNLRAKWRGRVERNEIMSSNEKLVIFTQLRHATSWAKLHAAKEIAEELDENKLQGVFFVAFRDTADAFTDMLRPFTTVGKITGDVSQTDRQKAIDDFQAGKIRFIVSTFDAGSVGITLNNGHHVILIDRPYTPASAIQAEARCYRIAQKSTVLVDWLQVNSTDQSIDNLLLKKQHNISTILTGNTSELPLDFDIRNNVEDIFNEIFK